MRNWILVVDDDDDIRDILTLLLRDSGYSVECAGDGVDAWEKMKRFGPPALVLLDLRMPRLSGGELLLRMHRTPGLAGIAVVILSGDSEAIEHDDLGVHERLRKPIELTDLMRVVERHLPHHHPAP